ncbi:MAG: hypothetical protein ACI9TF_000988 [Paracrocinitomix sp.]
MYRRGGRLVLFVSAHQANVVHLVVSLGDVWSSPIERFDRYGVGPSGSPAD